MIITDIVPKGKRQSVIWIDGQPAGFLDNRDITFYNLRQDEELNPVIWEKIEKELILPRGKRKAIELLEFQDRTTKELHDKLTLTGYTEQQTWEILAYVVSLHYIDEQRYAESYMRSHGKSKSRREMKQVLLMKGVPEELIEAAYENYRADCREELRYHNILAGNEDDGNAEYDDPEQAAVRKQIQKKFPDGSISASKAEKLYASLMRKGFSYDAIRSVMSEYHITEEEQ